MKYAEFERQALRLLDAPLGGLGFQHHGGAYFKRMHESWLDVLFFDLDRASKDAFTACIGISVPQVDEHLRKILPANGPPALLVSKYLGQLAKSGRGSQAWYRFGKSIPLADAVEQMLRDFEDQAVTWLDRFKSLEDVCAEYRRQRVSDVDGSQARSDPMAWAVYGLLLRECGRASEGTEWLSRAHGEVSTPLYSVDGREFSREKGPGARAVPRPSQERALASVLEDLLRRA